MDNYLWLKPFFTVTTFFLFGITYIAIPILVKYKMLGLKEQGIKRQKDNCTSQPWERL